METKDCYLNQALLSPQTHLLSCECCLALKELPTLCQGLVCPQSQGCIYSSGVWCVCLSVHTRSLLFSTCRESCVPPYHRGPSSHTPQANPGTEHFYLLLLVDGGASRLLSIQQVLSWLSLPTQSVLCRQRVIFRVKPYATHGTYNNCRIFLGLVLPAVASSWKCWPFVGLSVCVATALLSLGASFSFPDCFVCYCALTSVL